jgi:prefoldin subunit 5
MNEERLDKMRADIDELIRQVQELWQSLHVIREMIEDRNQH